MGPSPAERYYMDLHQRGFESTRGANTSVERRVDAYSSCFFSAAACLSEIGPSEGVLMVYQESSFELGRLEMPAATRFITHTKWDVPINGANAFSAIVSVSGRHDTKFGKGESQFLNWIFCTGTSDENLTAVAGPGTGNAIQTTTGSWSTLLRAQGPFGPRLALKFIARDLEDPSSPICKAAWKDIRVTIGLQVLSSSK